MNGATGVPLRVLVVHNRYRVRGGEDVVAEAEAALLREHGVEVRMYLRDNQELGQLSPLAAAAGALWSERSASEIDRLCAQWAPDLLHFHNTFPLISAAPYWHAARRRLPVVQTLHNFRLLCPQGTLQRHGAPCRACIGRVPWRAALHGCYHDSPAQSGVAASALQLHRMLGTYRHRIQAYITPSKFSRELYIAGGLPAARLHVKPHFIADDGQCPTPDQPRGGGLYVGRLSGEKGVAVLLRAMTYLGGQAAALRLAGDGPLAPLVQQRAPGAWLGRLSAEEVRAHMRRARFLVAPSTCLETFGLAVIEAFANGLPVIASNHGGLGELVRDGVTGLLVTPGDAADLAQKIRWALQHPQTMARMGDAARAHYLQHYTPAHNFRQLCAIYRAVLPHSTGENDAPFTPTRAAHTD
ncbi:glycosyltransferase [Duganella sp. FT134W]|uniref:Glycosyltransferase n=1 Tax=Duganella margarita TaxID=2692170 RepID=A0A7X4H489_9BURK|nr:glycosyltransferase family 4 protein [Duganella margarita]MYM73979.1 glycosyltransferase [Duganella margarita]